MTKLILVRHGQSQWNLENRFTGWKDVDLTEQGKKEAREAGDLLWNEKIDMAFTSVLIRAKHTLAIILKRLGKADIPIIENKALNERSYGDLEGKNKKEMEEEVGVDQVHQWRRSFDVVPPGGECLKDTCDRVIPYFEEQILPKIKEGKNIIISAHGNSLRALVMHLENLTPDEILKREIATGKPFGYAFDDQMNIEKLEEFKNDSTDLLTS